MDFKFDKLLKKLREDDAPALQAQIDILKNNEVHFAYFTPVISATGTIANKPAHASYLLDQAEQGLDGIVETLINGVPSGLAAADTLGNTIFVTSINAAGDYVLSGTPTAAVALIYVAKIPFYYWSEVDLTKVVGYPEVVTSLTKVTDPEMQAGLEDTHYATAAKIATWWAYIKGIAQTITGAWTITANWTFNGNQLFQYGVRHRVNNLGTIATGTINWDLDYTFTDVTLGANSTLDLTNVLATANQGSSFLLIIRQDPTGGRTLTLTAGKFRGTLVYNTNIGAPTAIHGIFSTVENRMLISCNTDTAAN